MAYEEHLKKRLEIAIEAAKQAGQIQHDNYQKQFTVHVKSSDVDLVTSVDHQCDALIRNVLTTLSQDAQLPQAGLITEETFTEETFMDLEQTWLVDPLDGTTNYAHGFPYFSVAIAFMQRGRPVVAVVYDPMRDELFTAIQGQGACLNGNPIEVSSILQLSSALLATGFPYDRHVKPQDNMAYFMTFMDICHGVRRAGSAALDLVYVASGRLDGFWELRLSPWDVAAGSLIVTEAGGKITDFQGNPLKYDQRRIDILGANNPVLLSAISDICTRKSNVAAIQP